MMKKQGMFVSLAAAAILSACASSQSESGLGKATVKLVEPEVIITQLSVLPMIARDMTGNIPIHYQVRVANRSGEPITLTRIEVRSIGQGAYTLTSQTHPFKQKIAPSGYEIVDFWAPAFIDDPTVYGANGPVTIRTVAHFDSPVGQFENVTVQQVHDRPGSESQPN